MPIGSPNKLEDILANYEPIAETGCWIWLGPLNKAGYGYIRYRNRMTLVHLLYFEYHKGPMPKGKQSDHSCEIKCCVNPEHILAATQHENLRRAGMLKLTDHQVREILTSGERTIRLAKQYNVSSRTIQAIRSNQARNNVSSH